MTRWRSVLNAKSNLTLFLALVFASASLLGDAAYATSGSQEPQSLTKEIRKTVTINYLLYLPRDYEKDKGKRWPLILFLHGAGERGTDLNKVKAYGPPKLVSEGREMPFIIVSPQVPERANWDPDALDALLDDIVERHAVDEDRLYLTGVSMGGAATWRLASARPERFAAMAPICGWGDPAMARRIGSIPTWVFHGANDDIVPLRASQEMVEALKQAGHEPKFTIYPETGHDSWTQAYNDPALFEWFLSHKRPSAKDK
jgi:predicted peptidase